MVFEKCKNNGPPDSDIKRLISMAGLRKNFATPQHIIMLIKLAGARKGVSYKTQDESCQ